MPTKDMFYVYVLESLKKNWLYVGFTPDLKARLEKHNLGLVTSTKAHRPLRVIHYETYLNETDARRREKYLKGSQGARLLKRMLKEYFYERKGTGPGSENLIRPAVSRGVFRRSRIKFLLPGGGDSL